MRKYLKIPNNLGMELSLELRAHDHGDIVHFRGTKTPREYINNGVMGSISINGIIFTIQSYSFPQIDMSHVHNSSHDEVMLYVGGEERNPSSFDVNDFISHAEGASEKLHRIFKPRTLNKSIHVI